MLEQYFLSWSHQNHLEDLFKKKKKKKQIRGFYPREPDLVGLGWGPRISISKKLPGDSGAIVAIHRPHTMFL